MLSISQEKNSERRHKHVNYIFVSTSSEAYINLFASNPGEKVAVEDACVSLSRLHHSGVRRSRYEFMLLI